MEYLRYKLSIRSHCEIHNNSTPNFGHLNDNRTQVFGAIINDCQHLYGDCCYIDILLCIPRFTGYYWTQCRWQSGEFATFFRNGDLCIWRQFFPNIFFLTVHFLPIKLIWNCIFSLCYAVNVRVTTKEPQRKTFTYHLGFYTIWNRKYGNKTKIFIHCQWFQSNDIKMVQYFKKKKVSRGFFDHDHVDD